MIQHLQGDCREVLSTLPLNFIDCCVTSPPYYGLRDYGADGQIGLEATPDEYVRSLVEVFRLVWQVLREDGTLWLNLGDSYAGSASTGGTGKETDYTGKRSLPTKGGTGIKQKDLIGIPWRVAFALQAEGWYLRSDIIWNKPNCMPESVTDRPTKSHEYIFLLAKSEKYYYDHEAIKEPVSFSSLSDGRTQRGTRGTRGEYAAVDGNCGFDLSGRNKRSVWTVPTAPYSGAHFAVFPPDLIRPCILAGCPAGGMVLDPFGGSGTTGLVAEQEGRNAILIELNPSYIELQKSRTMQTSLLVNIN